VTQRNPSSDRPSFHSKGPSGKGLWIALGGLGALAVVAVLVAAYWPAKERPVVAPSAAAANDATLVAYHRRRGVMNTVVNLTAVAGKNQARLAETTFDEVQALLADVEKRMSSHRPDSELSRLNAAPVGQSVALSVETLAVLRQARDFSTLTDGAFDVTCRPILETWRKAAKAGARPTEAEIQRAVEDTGWRWFRLTPDGAVRDRETATIDLGGIAKKHAIDRAVELMIKRGLAGGMVDIGGDIRCFGRPAEGDLWRIGLRNPFAEERDALMAVVAIGSGAVCTSGNYERFVKIGDRRYSHIADPRTGLPCEHAPSVSVVGPDAASAGLWATTLCVLGLEGLKRMPPDANLEALMVVGDSPEDSRWYRTKGIDRLLVDRPGEPPTEIPFAPGDEGAGPRPAGTQRPPKAKELSEPGASAS